jgi:hypothetical protein
VDYSRPVYISDYVPTPNPNAMFTLDMPEDDTRFGRLL